MNESTRNKIEQLIKLEGIGPEEFSRLLFGPAGLFGTLWLSDTEREALVRGDLYQRALARFTELKQAKLAQLRKARVTPQAKPDGVQQTPGVSEPQP